MNARQKAKLYKKQRDYLYQALLNSVYENHKIGEELRRDIIDIHVENRFNNEDSTYLDRHPAAVVDILTKKIIASDKFKQSMLMEKCIDPYTNETVYRAHLQTIRPNLEEL